MTSITFTATPIAGALLAAEQILGANRTWNPESDQQLFLVNEILSKLAGNEDKIGQFLSSMATWDLDEVNQFLEDEGFDIRLNSEGPDIFYIASVFTLSVEWLYQGEKYRSEDSILGKYKSFRLDDDAEFTSYFMAGNHPNPVVEITTKTEGVNLYITMAHQPASEFTMITHIMNLMNSPWEHIWEYGALQAPVIDLDQEVDVGWIVDMWTQTDSGQKARLIEALQQTKFKMDHKGAEVSSAFAAAAVLESISTPKEDLIINAPFYVWMTVDGLDFPVFAGWIDTDDWKKRAFT